MNGKLLISSVLLGCALLAVSANDAAAWRGGGGWFRYNYQRSFYRPGWTHNQTITQRSPGSIQGTRSFSRPNGMGANRQFSANCANGTCNKSHTTTCNSGKSWSHSASATSAKANNGTGTWQANTAGANGATTGRQGSCTAGAGCTGNFTGTGVNGNNYTAQRSATPNGQGGVNYSATFTGPNGTVTRTNQ